MRRLIAIVVALGALLLTVLPAQASKQAEVPLDLRLTWTCDFYERLRAGNPPVDQRGNLVPDPLPGEWYIVRCGDQQTFIEKTIQYWPNQPFFTGREIAALAPQILDFAEPMPNMAPPVDKRQLAGVRTWLWIDESAWQSGRFRIEMPGMAVRASAEPNAVEWVFSSADTVKWPNDVKTVTCKGPGTPYINELQPPTSCFRALQHAGTYHVDVSMSWTVLWVASDDTKTPPVVTAGTLDVNLPTDRLTIFADQRQAVITG